MKRDVAIERVSNRIELRSPYDPGVVANCKRVTGARWAKGRKCWTYPLEFSVCVELRGVFGDRLDVGPELTAWARAEKVRLADLEAVQTSDGADLELTNVPRYAPKIAAAMANRPYQRVAPAFGARAGSFWLFDQPGLGKSIMLLATVVEAYGAGPSATLILCPKTAVGVVWGPEVRQWLPDARVFEVRGTRAQREAVLAEATDAIAERSGHVFVVCNTEMVRLKGEPNPDDPRKKRFPVSTAEWPSLFGVAWDVVAVDESHNALVRTTGTPTQTRAGMVEIGKRCQRRIPLSGTPMRGKATNLWGTLNWTRPDVYTSYWKWAERYFKITSNGFSNFVIDKDDQWLPGGEARLGEDLKVGGLRRTKAEVLAELPPKTYAGSHLIPGDEDSPFAVWLTMEGKQAKQYASIEAEGMLATDNGETMLKGHLAEATRLKQSAGSLLSVAGYGPDAKVRPVVDGTAATSVKYAWLHDKLGELGILDDEGDGKIVVASQFTSLLNAFAEKLDAAGVARYVLTGATSDARRVEMAHAFQKSNDVRVFLLNMKAGGVAITLDTADDLVLLDETFDPDVTEQVEDRIHRTSRIHNVTIHSLKCLDTIEEEIAWVVAAREDVTSYLLDGARGVTSAKQRYLAKQQG